jgi:hypothetical protein
MFFFSQLDVVIFAWTVTKFGTTGTHASGYWGRTRFEIIGAVTVD